MKEVFTSKNPLKIRELNDWNWIYEFFAKPSKVKKSRNFARGGQVTRWQVPGDRRQVTGDRWRVILILNFHDKIWGRLWGKFEIKISTFSFIHDRFCPVMIQCHEMSWNWPRSRARKIIIFLNIFLNNIFPDIDWQIVCRHPGDIPGWQLTVDSWQLTVDSIQYTH